MKELIWTPVQAVRLEDLDVMTRARLVDNINSNYRNWKDLRRGTEDVWQEIDRHVNQYDPVYTRQSRMDHGYQVNMPGGFGSKLKMTNTMAHREGLVASVMKYLMSNDYDFFDIVPLDALDDEACDAVKQYLLWLYDSMGFEAAFTPFVRGWVQYGTGIASYEWHRYVQPRWLKSYFPDPETGDQKSIDYMARQVTYDAPKLTPLNIYHTVIDPTCDDLRAATLIFKSPKTPHEIMANPAYSGLKWDSVNSAPDFGSTMEMTKEINREWARGNTTYNSAVAYAGKKEITEAWGDFSDGYTLYKNYVAEILDGNLIRFEPNPYLMPYKPFIISRYCVEADRVYGASPLAAITGLQAGMDTITNQYIDYWNMEINRPILVQANTLVRSAKEDKTKLPPISKDAAWTVRDLNGVKRMDWSARSTSLDPTQMLAMLSTQMERATGDNELNSGGTPNPYVKTGVAMQAADAGSAKLNMYAKTLEQEAIISTLEMTIDMLRQMNVDPRTFKRTDNPQQEVTFNPAMLMNTIKFSMRGASYNMTKQVQVNTLQQFLMAIAANPAVQPLINWIKAIKIMGEALNIRHIDELINPQAVQMMQTMPQTQPTLTQRIAGFFTGQQGNPAVMEDNNGSGSTVLGASAPAVGGTTPTGPTTPGQPSPFDLISQR